MEPESEPRMPTGPKVRTCLWYSDQALQAAEFYCSIIPDSRIENIVRHPGDSDSDAGTGVLIVEFMLSGTPYQALNGGDHFKLNEAASVCVMTEDQAETDCLWELLTADGGSESRCGWLKDRFGLSWQIVPKRLAELTTGPNSSRVWPVLMQMRKIEIAELEAAAGLTDGSGTNGN